MALAARSADQVEQIPHARRVTVNSLRTVPLVGQQVAQHDAAGFAWHAVRQDAIEPRFGA